MPDAWWKMNKEVSNQEHILSSVDSPQHQPSEPAWHRLHRRPESRITMLNELRLYGALACVLQLVITVTLASVYAAKFYSHDNRLGPLPIVMWATTAVTAGLGLSAFLFPRPLLLVLHAGAALCAGAALGALVTGVFLMVKISCNHTHSSFSGCASCPCAVANTCTRNQLTLTPCDTCTAWATDVCKGNSEGVLPYMGFLQLLFICLPAAFSLWLLVRLIVRMERHHCELDGRLAYGRMLVASELERLALGLRPGAPPVLLRQMLILLLRYGSRTDVAAAHSCCWALGLSREGLEAGVVEWGPEGGTDSACCFFAKRADKMPCKMPATTTSFTTSTTTFTPVVFAADGRRLHPAPARTALPEDELNDRPTATTGVTAVTSTTAVRQISPAGGPSLHSAANVTASIRGTKEESALEVRARMAGVGPQGRTAPAGVGSTGIPMSSSPTTTAAAAATGSTVAGWLTAGRPPAGGPADPGTALVTTAAGLYSRPTADGNVGYDMQPSAVSDVTTVTTASTVPLFSAVRTVEAVSTPAPVRRTFPAGTTSQTGHPAPNLHVPATTSPTTSTTTTTAKVLLSRPPAAASSVSGRWSSSTPVVTPVTRSSKSGPNNTTLLTTTHSATQATTSNNNTTNLNNNNTETSTTATNSNTTVDTALVQKSTSQAPSQLLPYNASATGRDTVAVVVEGAGAASGSAARSVSRERANGGVLGVAAVGVGEAAGMGSGREPSTAVVAMSVTNNTGAPKPSNPDPTGPPHAVATQPTDAHVPYNRTEDVRTSYSLVKHERMDERELVTVFVPPPTSPSRVRVRGGDGDTDEEEDEKEGEDEEEEEVAVVSVAVASVTAASRDGGTGATAAGSGGNVLTSAGSREQVITTKTITTTNNTSSGNGSSAGEANSRWREQQLVVRTKQKVTNESAATTSRPPPAPPPAPPSQATELAMARDPSTYYRPSSSNRSAALEDRVADITSAAAAEVPGPLDVVAPAHGSKRGLVGPLKDSATATGTGAAGVSAAAADILLPGAATATLSVRARSEGFSEAVAVGRLGIWGGESGAESQQPPHQQPAPATSQSQQQQMGTTEPQLGRFKVPRRLKRNQERVGMGGSGQL